jgi:MFS family permease
MERLRGLEIDHNARMLLASQWVAQAADGLVQVVFANELILEAEATGGRLLALSALTLVPYSVIAPFLGVFVDRWARRSILVTTNVSRALLLLTVAFSVRAGEFDVYLYAVLLVLLGIGRLFLTTKGAALPVVFHEHHLLQGNSLSGGGGMISALLGGIAGVGLIGVTGPAPSLLASAVAYVAAALLARRISDPMTHELRLDERLTAAFSRVLREMIEGLRVIGRRAAVRLPLTGVFIVRTVAMIAAFAAIVIIKEEFPEAGDRFGRLSSSALALGAAGVGAFLGAVTAPAFGRRWNEPQVMLIGFVVSGVGIMALGGIHVIAAVLALTFIGGFGGFIAKVSVDSQVQQALPDEFRGRGFAVYDVIYNMASVAAAAILILGQETSLRGVIVAAGAASLLGAVAIGAALRQVGLLAPAQR